MRVAINGLGRIGRAVFKLLVATPELKVAAVNDVTPAENLAYLLNHDTVYGRYANRVTVQANSLIVADQSYPVYAEPEPSRLPWRRLNVDLVFECTGQFDRRAELSKHLQAGAKRVILSAPAKDDDIPTVVFGVNVYDEKDGAILSCASCTTNCVAPIVEIIGRHFGTSEGDDEHRACLHGESRPRGRPESQDAARACGRGESGPSTSGSGHGDDTGLAVAAGTIRGDCGPGAGAYLQHFGRRHADGARHFGR